MGSSAQALLIQPRFLVQFEMWMYKYLTLPYLHGDRVIKATWPGDPVLIELSARKGMTLIGFRFGTTNIRLAQWRSSLALNWLMDEAETTEAGSEFQAFTTLALNPFLRDNDLSLGFVSFHWCPLVRSESCSVRNQLTNFFAIGISYLWLLTTLLQIF